MHSPLTNLPTPIVRRLGDYAPRIAGAAAYHRFCTPHLSTHRSDDHETLVKRARAHLRDASPVLVPTTFGRLQAYIFNPANEDTEPKDSILLVHGWTGEASFMSVFAEYFRRRGHRVVLFDLPAHGKSPGKHISLIGCAHAVREVAEALGPFRSVVAHSIGGLASLLAGGDKDPMPHAYPFEKYVLVSVPNRFTEVTENFSREIGLSRTAQQNFEQRLERIAYRELPDFTAAQLLTETDRPALIIHAYDDAEVPYDNAQQVEAACEQAELQTFDGLGHRHILYAPPVVRVAATYLDDR